MPTTISVLDAAAASQTVNTLPALGQAAKAASLPFALASDDSSLALLGAVNETAPATDTASSGHSGRLQRIAQRLTSLIALVPASLGQKAMSASMAVVVASDQAAIPVSGVPTTVGQKAMAASLAVALASDQSLIPVGGSSTVIGGTFNRPGDTTAYAVGDLVANNTTAGSVTPISCSVSRVNDATAVIRRIRFSTNKTGGAGTEVFRVHLFKTSPTVANGDNGAFSANGIASLAQGFFDVTMASVYNDGSKGYVACDVVVQPTSGAQTIFALIEARTAYTPANGETFTLALEVLQD